MITAGVDPTSRTRPDDVDFYVRLATRAGCSLDQVGRFLAAGIILQERQLAASAAARLCDEPDGPTAIGYGGARGGGKSHWLLAQMGADDCQRVPGLKCLLLRKVGKANIENFEDLRHRLFGALPHTFSASRAILTFANGSRIIAGHFQSEKDIDAYLGLEYDVIGIEEATTLTARKFQDIATCCRTSKVLPNGQHWRPRIYSTTNPGGVGHAWYKTKFIQPHQQRRESDTRFIPARVTDNPFINAGYVNELQRLTGWKKQGWLLGDWDFAAGQFFTGFRRDVHIIDQFDTSRAHYWFAALDYGFSHYTVALLACADGDGNVFVLDEHAERMWLPQHHAVSIKAMCARHRVRVHELRSFVAGSDVFSAQYDGTSIFDQYSEIGIYLSPANMERVNGWAEVQRRLGDPAAGIRPTLYIHRRCTRLIECLPALQHDPTRPEDVLKADIDEEGNGGDDAADALRYLIATKPNTIVEMNLTGL